MEWGTTAGWDLARADGERRGVWLVSGGISWLDSGRLELAGGGGWECRGVSSGY